MFTISFTGKAVTPRSMLKSMEAECAGRERGTRPPLHKLHFDALQNVVGKCLQLN